MKTCDFKTCKNRTTVARSDAGSIIAYLPGSPCLGCVRNPTMHDNYDADQAAPMDGG